MLRNLLDRILELPELSLKESEWQTLTELFSTLPDGAFVSAESFTSHLEGDIEEGNFKALLRTQFWGNQTLSIIDYLKKWYEVACLIRDQPAGTGFVENMVENLPKALPDDLGLIKKVFEKTRYAQVVDVQHQLGFSFSVFHSVITAKYQELLQERAFKKQISLSIKICEKYLAEGFAKITAVIDEFAYGYYFNLNDQEKGTELLLNDLSVVDAEDIFIKGAEMELDKERVLPLAEDFYKKVLMIKDFIQTLTREHYTGEKILTEFIAKFFRYQPDFTPQPAPAFYLCFFDNIFTRETTEAAFFTKLYDIIKQNDALMVEYKPAITLA